MLQIYYNLLIFAAVTDVINQYVIEIYANKYA